MAGLLDLTDHDRWMYHTDLDDGTRSEIDRARYSSSKSLDNSLDTIADDVRNATINEIFDRISLLWDVGLLSDKSYGLTAMSIYELLNDVTSWNYAKSHKFVEWTRGNIPNKQGDYKQLDDNKIWEVLLALRSKNVADFNVSTTQLKLNFDLVVDGYD